MLSLERIRKIDPALQDYSDEELLKIRDDLYGLGQLAFESWARIKNVSKNPDGVLMEQDKGVS